MDREQVYIDGSGPVIIVDDSRRDLELMNMIFARSRISNELHVFSNGQACLDYMSEAVDGENPVPSLVLIDIKMPAMNGFELIERIRDFDDETIQNLPLAVLTSSKREEDRQRALGSGADGYFTKKSDMDEYIELFNSLVHSSS